MSFRYVGEVSEIDSRNPIEVLGPKYVHKDGRFYKWMTNFRGAHKYEDQPHLVLPPVPTSACSVEYLEERGLKAVYVPIPEQQAVNPMRMP